MRRAYLIAGGTIVLGAAIAVVVARRPRADVGPGSIPKASGPTAQALDGRLTVPEGFKVAYFAREVGGARVMAMAPDGAVYVSIQAPSQVLRLSDTDGDGVADDRRVAVGDLNVPSGLAFHGEWLYIANTDGVVRVRLRPDGTADGTPEVLNHVSPLGSHRTRTLLFVGDTMYLSIGSSCNICMEKAPERATVMRYDENGRNGRVYASGLRNAVGLALNPVTGQIWASTHERDDLKPDYQDLPPEEIDILEDGGRYGWPYCYGAQVPNPDRMVRDSVQAGVCARTIAPALTMQAHAAPLGMTFLDRATMFPEDYRGDLLLALHGSWNRDYPVGAVVVRVRVRDGKPAAYEEFVSGWQEASGPGQPKRWGRPADVAVYKDGSVLISDDQAGAIYRVYR